MSLLQINMPSERNYSQLVQSDEFLLTELSVRCGRNRMSVLFLWVWFYMEGHFNDPRLNDKESNPMYEIHFQQVSAREKDLLLISRAG